MIASLGLPKEGDNNQTELYGVRVRLDCGISGSVNTEGFTDSGTGMKSDQIDVDRKQSDKRGSNVNNGGATRRTGEQI